MKDAVRQVDATVTNEAVPDGDQTGILLCGIGSLEIFIHNCPNWVDR
jgi:hypothetical protein